LIASCLLKKVISIAINIPVKPTVEKIELYSLLILKIFSRLVINKSDIPAVFKTSSVLFKPNHSRQEGHCFSIKILFY